MSSLKRKWWIGLAAVIVVAIVAVAVWPGEREPEYQGKKLSEWLEFEKIDPYDAGKALSAIGTNALPTMVAWLRYERPRWREIMARNYSAMPKILVSKSLADRILRGRKERAAESAARGFIVLGPQASPAVPELIALMRDTNAPMSRCRALVCLSHMEDAGLRAIPYVRDFAGSGGSPEVSRAIRRLTKRQMEVQAREMIEKARREPRLPGDWVPLDENRVWYEQ